MNQEVAVLSDLEKDFASLARLAAAESYEDVRMLLARLVRKYRQEHPDFAAKLDQSLKSSHIRGPGSSSALRRAPQRNEERAQEAPVDQDSQLSLIRVFDDRGGMAPPLLQDDLMRQIEAIIRERKERDRLISKGISPTRSAVLVGPPGVGKSLSARWIASSLGLPLWILDLTAVMSSLLGKTGSNLRAALDYAKANSAVLLLDEIDAIAKRRSDASDIGELKRLVTVILQEVDQWPDSGLLLAATNHPELVDPALWRRFDSILTFTGPNETAVDAAVRRFLGDDMSAFSPWIDVISASLRGRSLSDVERAINAMRRSYALQTASVQELVTSVIGQSTESMSKAHRQQLAIELARAGTHTHMQISQMTGVARDTIRRHAGPSPRKGRGHK
ncbi:MAG: ATP-binding protein [Gallionella sp.]|nr:ATP-binding protein [Gallionella sp.]